MGTGQRVVLEARGISKHFGRVAAVNGVDVSLLSGEVLGIVGDNGAGKSTLIKMLTGALSADSGQIVIHGRPAEFRSTRDARRAGVASVFQQLDLVDDLDIATNLFLGDFPRRGPFIDRRRMQSVTAATLRRFGIASHAPETPVWMLTGGHRQLVSIARALRLSAQVIVMDEPTAALGVRERMHVAGILRGLRDEGRSVIVVSHDLTFILDVADRIHVMRLGRNAGVREVPGTDRDEILGLIAGSGE